MRKRFVIVIGFVFAFAAALFALRAVNSTSQEAADIPNEIQETDSVGSAPQETVNVPEPTPVNSSSQETYDDSSFSLELNGQSCQIKRGHEVVYCQWEDETVQTIHPIGMPDEPITLFFYEGKLAGLETPVVVVSDYTGVSGGGAVSFYRYDPAQEEWRDVPYRYDGNFMGFAIPDEDGSLLLAEKYPIDLGGWGLNVYSLAYDAEQDFVKLEGPTVYDNTDLVC